MGAATAGWVGAVVLVMTLASAAGAVAPPTVVHRAPYSGSVGPGSYVGIDNCAKATLAKNVAFSMHTGKGGFGVGSASAKTCGSSLAGVGAYSEGYAEPDLSLAFSERLPTGSHSVAVNWNLAWNSSGHYSILGSCPAAKPFHNSYSYTSSTYAYWDNYSGMQSYCAADSESDLYLEEMYLEDLNTGAQTFSNSCSSSYCFQVLNDSYISIYNESGYELYNYTTWTSSGGYTYSAGSYSLNYSGHYGGTSFGGPGGKVWTNWFNGTFVSTHKYALVYYFYGFNYAFVEGFPSATASVAFNMGTLGNGLDLSSVAIT